MSNGAKILNMVLDTNETQKTLKNNFPTVLNDLDKLNHKKRIKIRYKKIKQGYSLYLDIWNNGKREYQFLKLYVLGRRDTKKQDSEAIKLSTSIREKKELELLEKDFGFQLTKWKTKADFIEYFKSIANKKLNQPTWPNTLKHLIDFTKGKIRFEEIDIKFCEDFGEYICEKVSANTANSYYARFKSALEKAVRDNVIEQNPANNFKVKKRDVNREFLTIEEIRVLKKTQCKNHQLKNAFLFSCFTGLRLSDIESMTKEQIHDKYIQFRQQKTGDMERIKLNPDALKIIEEQIKTNLIGNSNIFNLPSRTHIKRLMRKWLKESHINKHITFHCARHTFATLCLTYDVDLYTVSKLLGHRDIKTTQIYAKLIDKKKDEAIDKLPELM